MNELVSKLAEILEVEKLDLTKHFSDYEGWDSLAALSILALLDSDYQKSMKISDIRNFKTINDFCQFVLG